VSNAETIAAMVDVWNREDREGYLSLLAPDVVQHTGGVFPDFEPVYQGREGAARFWDNIHEPFETLLVELGEVVEKGDAAVVEYWFRAKGADSGLDVRLRVCHAVSFRDGLVVCAFARFTYEEAAEALGWDA
jgi:ketosteroid isomerase-like protein